MTDLRVGDRCRYQPIGSNHPHVSATVLDIRRKQDTPGVFSDATVRVQIRRGRGGWVNADRVFAVEEGSRDG